MALYHMLSNIKNAQKVKRAFLFQKRKKLCEQVLDLLWNEGYILGYQLSFKNSPKIKIFLKYSKGKPAIKIIRAFSKPGKRIYYSLSQLWKINSNASFFVLSTNKGIKTLDECKRSKIGGEPLFMIS
jgi:small subunit ribosomal protein S8